MGQSVQDEKPAELAYLPASQARQLATAVEGFAWPGRQGRQELEPRFGWNSPGPQLRQVWEPVVLAYCPEGHKLHCS
jgi:hypothetical protein